MAKKKVEVVESNSEWTWEGKSFVLYVMNSMLFVGVTYTEYTDKPDTKVFPTYLLASVSPLFKEDSTPNGFKFVAEPIPVEMGAESTATFLFGATWVNPETVLTTTVYPVNENTREFPIFRDFIRYWGLA